MSEPSGKPALAKPKKRWLRFTLRTLLLLTAVVACWLGVQVNKAQKQRAAVAAIEEAGGVIIYDDMWMRRNPYKDHQQTREGFAYMFKRMLGEEYAREVSIVDLESVEDKVIADLVVKLIWLPETSAVGLKGPNVTDVEIAHVAKLPNLKELVLAQTQVTDAALTELKASRPQLTVKRIDKPTSAP